MYFSAISMAERPSSASASSILSRPVSLTSSVMCPTSVMFMTHVTSWPSNRRPRRMRSPSMNERMLPMWMYRYTVGPQEYIFTVLPSTGLTSLTWRVSES